MTLGIAVALFAVVAVANWWSRWTGDDRVELLTKPTATVLAMVVALASGGDDLVVALTVVGLVFCLIGDVALMPAIDRFVVGLAAFLVGHLVFVGALVADGLSTPWLSLVAVALLLALLGRIARPIVAGAKRQDPGLGPPVMAYLVIISSMAIVAWATGEPAAIIGATSFVVSDSILGWRTFVSAKRWMAVGVMSTYHAALLGLALAAA